MRYLKYLLLTTILTLSASAQVATTFWGGLRWDTGPTAPTLCYEPGFYYQTSGTSQIYMCDLKANAYITIPKSVGGVFTTPNLGTPSALTLTNATGAPSSVPIGSVVSGMCHAQYNFTVDGGGAPGLITPAANCTIPANSIIFNEIIDWTTAGQGATNTTAIGTTGTGGATNSLLHATTVASLTGIVQGQIVPQTASGFVKITTAGVVTLTTATAALTAGVADVYVFYVTASN